MAQLTMITEGLNLVNLILTRSGDLWGNGVYGFVPD